MRESVSQLSVSCSKWLSKMISKLYGKWLEWWSNTVLCLSVCLSLRLSVTKCIVAKRYILQHCRSVLAIWSLCCDEIWQFRISAWKWNYFFKIIGVTKRLLGETLPPLATRWLRPWRDKNKISISFIQLVTEADTFLLGGQRFLWLMIVDCRSQSVGDVCQLES